MKARVKETGEIVDVSMECKNSTDYRKAIFRTKDGMCYRYNEIELTFDKIKARVKSTGDIFEISDTTTIYPEHYDKSYNITEVEFFYVKENAFSKDDNLQDYWQKLEHQYAGMAMQGILSNPHIAHKDVSREELIEHWTGHAVMIAVALVKKLKEKEEK